MAMQHVMDKGLILLGCGKMGGALLEGWLKAGLLPQSVHALEPSPSARLLALQDEGLHLNAPLPKRAAVCVIAVKPQMMGSALPALKELGNGSTVFVSIAAGTTLGALERVLGAGSPIVRAMPNTPAAIGLGITALVGNANVDPSDMGMAEVLMQAVGQTLILESEAQMDAVTALSGSGPAYVFLLIEAMAHAGILLGLTPEVSMRLAKATVSGAGALSERATEDPAQLRVNVTSPGGTTAAALQVLMDRDSGLQTLMLRAMAAAAARSKELAS